MGNWMSVWIVGTCKPEEVAALKKAISWDDPGDDFHCLSNTTGLSSLGDWAQENINSMGNLSERDYTPKNVADTLKKLSKVAPSLEVRVHCGGDNESKKCVATIDIQEGFCVVLEPHREIMIPELPTEIGIARLMGQLRGQAESSRTPV